MATWEDGPEYAPAERPGEFRAPEVAPLDAGPAPETPPVSGPGAAPSGFRQDAPVAPLSAYAPPVEPPRDPHRAFQVAATALTQHDSAWSATHWHQQPADQHPHPAPAPPGGSLPLLAPPAPAEPGRFPGPPATPATGALPPPTGEPISPGEPIGPRAAVPPGESTWPGRTPEVIDSRPDRPYPAGRPVAGAGRGPMEVFRAMTPALPVTLLLGGVIGPFSPLLFLVAMIFAGRVRVAKEQVLTTFRVGTAALLTTILVGLAVSGLDVPATYSLLCQVAVALCWIALIAVAGQVWMGLGRDSGPDHPPGRP